MKETGYLQLATQHWMKTWNDFFQFFFSNHTQLADIQSKISQSYFDFQHYSEDAESADNRFQDERWKNNLFYNFIKRFYFASAYHFENIIETIAQQDSVLGKKLRFYTRQFIDASSPTNFVNFNPEVFSKILETNGENLITGLKQFIADCKSGKNYLHMKITDFDVFQLGTNIACTPGEVIYQNNLMQLIQYTPSTTTVHQYPLLIIPPWIKKYYILDLQEHNSLVKWLVDQGHTVFMISWINPDERHSDKQFEDYLFEGPLEALKVIAEVTGQTSVNALGYCIGGTLLGCLLAYLAKQPEMRILSATFLTTLLDFSAPGELGVFIDDEQIELLESHMRLNGYLDGNVLAVIFDMLRANDMIWSSFINNYLKGQKPNAFDLLYWNADTTNVPEQVHSFYLRNMYLHNHLVQPNKIRLGDVTLDISQSKVPNYFLATKNDHIAPWKACYQSQQYLSGKSKFVLTNSGHVAGVVNPPYKKKYGYWTNRYKPKKAEDYLAGATFQEGSWWIDWQAWLKKFAGKKIPVSRKTSYQSIESAPGSYVRVCLNK